MPLAKRIIPCLDVDNGRVVKGVKFVEIRDAGDPVENARRYNLEGADELTFLDITASSDDRETMVHVVEAVAKEVFIPLTVGGGIREVSDIRRMLNAGADKVSINTAAVFNPEFVKQASDKFGSQCIVVAVDAKNVSTEGNPDRWEIFTHGGRKPTGIDAKRIIPCLDVDNGRVVKGVKFVEIRDAGDPVENARRYNLEGADELTFLDITASSDDRETMVHVVEAVAKEVFIPLTVGGGIREVSDIRRMLNAGADKVSINTAAVFNPEFVKQASDKFGSQCIVVAVDAKNVSTEGNPDRWEIFTHGGRKPTGIDAMEWVCKMDEYGAGEILLTSMDRDGTKIGFDNELTRRVSEAVRVPVIASGGVGNLQHLADGVLKGKADAVLAASIFHFGEYRISEAKAFMASCGIEVRL